MTVPGSFKQKFGPVSTVFVGWGNLNIQRQLGFDIDSKVRRVAEEDVFGLHLCVPSRHQGQNYPGAAALSLAGAGLPTKAIGIALQASGNFLWKISSPRRWQELWKVPLEGGLKEIEAPEQAQVSRLPVPTRCLPLFGQFLPCG